MQKGTKSKNFLRSSESHLSVNIYIVGLILHRKKLWTFEISFFKTGDLWTVLSFEDWYDDDISSDEDVSSDLNIDSEEIHIDSDL